MTRAALAFLAAACLALISTGLLAAQPTMKPFGSASWQTLRAAHKGKPLIVHFWSIACGPCIEELPKWAAFLKAHPKAPVIFVDWDRPGGEKDRITAELQQVGLATADNWTLDADFEAKLRFHIDRGWMGELPRTETIARNGTVTGFSGAADFNKLADWLKAQSQD